jgi:copper chaperone
MVTFEVNDMTCGHCVSSITKAVRSVDGDAQIRIDLASHLVQIEPTQAGASDLAQAIKEAGYTPVETAGTPVAPTATATRSGCCCR